MSLSCSSSTAALGSTRTMVKCTTRPMVTGYASTLAGTRLWTSLTFCAVTPKPGRLSCRFGTPWICTDAPGTKHAIRR